MAAHGAEPCARAFLLALGRSAHAPVTDVWEIVVAYLPPRMLTVWRPCRVPFRGGSLCLVRAGTVAVVLRNVSNGWFHLVQRDGTVLQVWSRGETTGLTAPGADFDWSEPRGALPEAYGGWTFSVGQDRIDVRHARSGQCIELPLLGDVVFHARGSHSQIRFPDPIVAR